MTKTALLDDIRKLYDRFDHPITSLDCGQKCAPYNPSGKPFCCDICQAVPVAFQQEWEYVKGCTDLWHEFRGDECASDPINPQILLAETPTHQVLLACKGPDFCQREYRASSCRQFPFFPYITSTDRLIGMAYYWDFEPTCWVISNLGQVAEEYRKSFISIFDDLLNTCFEEFESYAALSGEMREHFLKVKRRFPILHRNGEIYLVSPGNERMRKTLANRLGKFGVYA